MAQGTRTGLFLVVGALAAGCGSNRVSVPAETSRQPAEALLAPSAAPEAGTLASDAGASIEGPPPSPAAPEGPVGKVSDRYEAYRKDFRDLTYEGLAKELRLGTAKDPGLPFDPTTIRYFDSIATRFFLTEPERARFRSEGVTNVDHVQAYSMATAYHAIYTRDLPVLVTTDSVLHALHRSFDRVLMDLEEGLFTATIIDVLASAHSTLETNKSKFCCKFAETARDADLYLTVARNLLAGAGATAPGAALPVASKLGTDAAARDVLGRIASLRLETPDSAGTPIYGGLRYVDWSQFKPRGHYTKSAGLQKYFRALMWLGRADLGFTIAPPDPRTKQKANSDRELRAASLVTWLVSAAGKAKAMDGMSAAIDYLVGRADSLTMQSLGRALDHAGVKDPLRLLDRTTLGAVRDTVLGASDQQIRSQVLVSPAEDPKEVPPPKTFQVFGQRFAIDSFVLSKVVYDSIVFKDKKIKRFMPSALDVMAALGNDDAVELLRPELEKYPYSTNLLALRRTVDERPASEWQETAYGRWLDALRTLDDRNKSPRVPASMRRTAWRRKQLQTQLASWAELRHDTILYAKQSYGATVACEYPEGYVEPYPELFGKLRSLAFELGARLGALEVPGSQQGSPLLSSLKQKQQFFEAFGKTMLQLEALSRKELAAAPFTREEASFLKRTIDIRGGGSGPPTYTGWYPQLFYGHDPTEWDPTVADIHTDPEHQGTLEVGVGNANFIVVAVDNGKDRAAYVGPVYSYYEFSRPASDRLTDEEWQDLLKTDHAPPRPTWSDPFRPPGSKRQL